MNLYIDTADFSQITFALSDGKKMQKKVYRIDAQKSHQTLSRLEEFLKGKTHQVAKIFVNKGPGSYTGVRVGLVMAQALGLAWGVKVVPKSSPQMQKLLQ